MIGDIIFGRTNHPVRKSWVVDRRAGKVTTIIGNSVLRELVPKFPYKFQLKEDKVSTYVVNDDLAKEEMEFCCKATEQEDYNEPNQAENVDETTNSNVHVERGVQMTLKITYKLN